MIATTTIQRNDRNEKAVKGQPEHHDINGMPKEEHGADSGLPLFLERSEAKAPASPPPVQRQPLEEEQETDVLPKLNVGAPDDEYEREADQVAETVMGMPNSSPLSTKNEEDEQPGEAGIIRSQSATPHFLQRSFAECGEENQGYIRRLTAVQKKSKDTFAIPEKVAKTLQTASGGSYLPKHVRSNIEAVLDSDLSHVKVFSDNEANKAAQSINAKAFAHKNRIYLGKGQSVNDVRLMAHEAAHVAQQHNKGSIVQRSVPFDLTLKEISAEEASDLTMEELRIEIQKLKNMFKGSHPGASYDTVSWNIGILENELADKKLELETARKDYRPVYEGFLVAAEDSYGNLLIRYSDGTTITVSAWKEKFRLAQLPKPSTGHAGFKFSMKEYLDPIKRYYPAPIYREDAAGFHDQLKLLKKPTDSLNDAELVLRLEQINKVMKKIGDTEPVYPHLFDESARILKILKKKAEELEEKVKAVRDDPEHVDNMISKLDMYVEATIDPGKFVDFVYVKITYMNGMILWLSLTFSDEKEVWKMKETKGQHRFLYIPRKIPSELRPDTAPHIFGWFYHTYPYVYGERVQKFLKDSELFKQVSFQFSEILSMNLMGLNPYWAAIFLGYEGISGERVFHPGEKVPTWERILNIATLAAPFVLKRLKFRRPKMPEITAGEIPAKEAKMPVRIEKGKLVNTKNRRELIIDDQGIIRYRNTKSICRSCNPDYYELKAGRWRKKPGVELPTSKKSGKKGEFGQIAGKKAVPYNPEVPATRLGMDTSRLSQFGPYTNSEAAVQRILRKKSLNGIKGQLAEEVVNSVGTSEAAKIKPKFTEKGSTVKYFRGDEVAAPAPKQKSAGAQRADITDGIVAEIYSEGGAEKLYIHRIYEVKSGSGSAQKLSAQVGWDMERIKELGISVKVTKPGGGYVWKEFAPQDISMVPRSSQASVAKGYVPSGVKAPKGLLTEQYQAFELPGISELDLYEAALMILRQKRGGG